MNTDDGPDWLAADTLRAYEEQAMTRVMEQTEMDVIDALPRECNPPVVVEQPTKTAITAMATPAELLRYAMDSGADLDRLERLMDMQTKWEANEARKAYALDMAEFKKNAPTIIKDKTVNFETSKGWTTYDHATIGNVVEKVVASLAEHGFSHSWIPSRGEGGMISVTCEITHKLGYSKSITLEAGLDQSGGKNNIQAQASTITYLERYTLLAATGLAVKDKSYDDDGAGSGAPIGAREQHGMSDSEMADLTVAMREADDEESLLRVGSSVPATATDAQKAELAAEYTKRRKALKASKGA
ncbi:ERF family protein [Burkholderia sp. GbtcB21]|uniref:ERF family protein n=1 Tax=Burkholderia sp. GbtcB21 TaxID=2824766 RepID=UPI001C2F3CA3|nr:ERF family protein [Burkholderia sp. GbtcB21]